MAAVHADGSSAARTRPFPGRMSELEPARSLTKEYSPAVKASPVTAPNGQQVYAANIVPGHEFLSGLSAREQSPCPQAVIQGLQRFHGFPVPDDDQPRFFFQRSECAKQQVHLFQRHQTPHIKKHRETGQSMLPYQFPTERERIFQFCPEPPLIGNNREANPFPKTVLIPSRRLRIVQHEIVQQTGHVSTRIGVPL